MTMFGKVLVFVNFTLSVLAFGWAFMLYASRTDWSTNKAQGTRPAGELVARQEAVKNAWDTFPPAQAAYRDANDLVTGQEAWRPVELKFYADQHAHLRSG